MKTMAVNVVFTIIVVVEAGVGRVGGGFWFGGRGGGSSVVA